MVDLMDQLKALNLDNAMVGDSDDYLVHCLVGLTVDSMVPHSVDH